jgi:hypothetical protein
MTPVPSEITSQLVDWSNGDGDALEKLLPLVEHKLRQIKGINQQ